MPEYGFYHPVDGYWQTVSEVPPSILATYPEGTIQVPLRPGPNYLWDGTQWIVDPSPIIEVPQTISFAQLLIGLVSEGWITEAEGRAWRDRVSLPLQVQTVIATLPQNQQFAAETRALAPSEVYRSDPLVLALGVAAQKTTQELDNFFITYSQV